MIPAVKSGAPEDTGALQRAIRVRSSKRSRRYIGAVVTLRHQWIPGKWFYPAFHEWGYEDEPAKLYMEKAGKRIGRRVGNWVVMQIQQGIENAARR
jgi:hypothetical protein